MESSGNKVQSFREINGKEMCMGVWSRRRVSEIGFQRRREVKGKEGILEGEDD